MIGRESLVVNSLDADWPCISGASMFAHQLITAIEAASFSNLDHTAQLVWRSLASGLVSDGEAEALSVAIEARREALRATRVNTCPCPRTASGGLPRQRRTSSERMLSRRRWAGSGAIPSTVAMHFTTGEAAVLSVIARQVQRRGSCDYFMDQLAAVAGVSRTTARNALRLAQELGLVVVEERRVTGNRNLSNVVRIISKEWISWLGLTGRGGGCRNVLTTSNHLIQKGPLPVPIIGDGQREGREVKPPDVHSSRLRPSISI